MPNNPAIKAPIPIPMVPMDTFEAEGTFQRKVGGELILFTFRSSASKAFRFESSISSTISWVDWTFPLVTNVCQVRRTNKG